MAFHGMTLSRAADPTTLRQAAHGVFLIGAAVRPDALRRPDVAAVVGAQFDCLTAENVFKPLEVQPRRGEFRFGPADAVADFAAAHGQKVVGHTLCWHQQTPAWMFLGADGKPLPREQGLANLKAHIDAVVGHFKGRVLGWDVVNEAIDDAEDKYLRDTPARRSIGDDYVVQAFKFAQAADPGAELFYNDYGDERGTKLAKAVRLIGELKAAGVRIDGVGIQGHWGLDWPSVDDIDAGITALAATGVKVHVTELDIDVLPRESQSANVTDVQQRVATTQQNPYTNGLPTDLQTKLADRYAAVFGVFYKHRDVVERVTLWGVDDGTTWLNNFPVRGRTNYPLLLDRQLRPKPAFYSVIAVLQGRAR